MDPERRTPVLMKRFYTAIVRRRRLVLAVFALAAVLSVFAVRQVKVDYDINDYLPPESPSTTAIEVMNGAFTGAGVQGKACRHRRSVLRCMAGRQSGCDSAFADAGHRHGGELL